MNWVSIRNTKDITLEGITVDTEWRDKVLGGLTLTDAKGAKVRLVLENYEVRAPSRTRPLLVSGLAPRR